MVDNTDSFFEGLDDAEEVSAAAPEVEAPDAPEASAAAAAAPEAAAPADAAAAPASAAAPAAPVAPVAPAAAADPDPARWVPVGAHIELRDQLKAMREELRALKNPPPVAPAPTPPPDFQADPKAYVDHRVNAALEQLEGSTKKVTETAQHAASTAQEAAFRQSLAVGEQQFEQSHPDYKDALQHLRTIRVTELAMLHPQATQEQVITTVMHEELGLAANLLRTGRNPSEVAYNLAKARGYAPKQPAPPANVAQLLPPVGNQPKKLAPDLTLGTGAGAPAVAEDITQDNDVFDQAWNEMFGGRKRA